MVTTREARSPRLFNPIPYGCKLYLPLWHNEFRGGVFSSADDFRHTLTVTGTYIGWGKTASFTTSNQVLTALGQGVDSFSYGHITFRTLTVSALVRNRLSIGVRDNTNRTDWRWTTDNDTNLANDTLYMVAITQTSGTVAMFINGASVGITQDLAGTRTGASFANSKTLLGARSTNAAETYDSFLNGLEGDQWVFNQAFTASEIQRIYLATKWRYSG